ncbi:MAG: alanine dehydrogenase [Candidatus Hadarchaeales archaeon]
MRTLILSRAEVEKVLSVNEAIRAVEAAFREKGMGRVQMPPKSYVFFEEYDGDFRTMPAYLRKIGAAGVKVVNVHQKNKKRGLPTVMATIILLDPKTGHPLAVMDGTFITNIRTGAAGVLAAKHLARKNSESVGMVGSGVQARFQLMALLERFDPGEVRAWSRNMNCARNYAAWAKKNLDICVSVERRVEDAVRGADIIVTTTPSRVPLVMNEWVSEGTHINAIGADAPGKQELDPAILRRSKLVIDDMEQATHSGEINVPLSKNEITTDHIYAELGEIVCGRKRGRTSDDEITVFDSTGLAVQDIATAAFVYRKAVKKGLGKEVDLIGA